MQRIRPARHRSVLLRNEEHFVEDTVSELGIYGTFIRRGTEILLNQSAGHLLRTKVVESPSPTAEPLCVDGRWRHRMKEEWLQASLFSIRRT